MTRISRSRRRELERGWARRLRNPEQSVSFRSVQGQPAGRGRNYRDPGPQRRLGQPQRAIIHWWATYHLGCCSITAGSFGNIRAPTMADSLGKNEGSPASRANGTEARESEAEAWRGAVSCCVRATSRAERERTRRPLLQPPQPAGRSHQAHAHRRDGKKT